MQVTALLKNLRISPRKARLVSGLVRGMDAQAAQHQLYHMTKRTAGPLYKLIDSALANAYHNFGLVKENLFIKELIVNEGRKLKRYRPKGFGSASPLQKKTTHIKVVLDERVPGLRADKKTDESAASEATTEVAAPKKRTARARAGDDTATSKKASTKAGPKTKLFRRKAI